MARKHRGGRDRRTTSGETAATSTARFKALTPNHEDAVFTRGSTQDAAKFAATLTRLLKHVSVQGWTGSNVATKSMVEITPPANVKPVRPKRLYFLASSGGVSASRATTFDRLDPGDNSQNKIVISDIDYTADIGEYLEASKEWKRDFTQWTENNARIFNLVLQHCHPEVEAELKNHTNWLVARSNQDSIALLLITLSTSFEIGS